MLTKDIIIRIIIVIITITIITIIIITEPYDMRMPLYLWVLAAKKMNTNKAIRILSRLWFSYAWPPSSF